MECAHLLSGIIARRDNCGISRACGLHSVLAAEGYRDKRTVSFLIFVRVVRAIARRSRDNS